VSGIIEKANTEAFSLIQHDETSTMDRTMIALVKLKFVSAALLVAAIAGCSQQRQSPQDLKEQTAKATATLKSDAKAGAEGVREGWNRDKGPVDLNSASKEQLVAAGLTSSEADRVIAGRPYNEPADVVTRHILSKAEYDKIAERITAGK
jgi:DNA uptake protein ComE-like DNA-binding protein